MSARFTLQQGLLAALLSSWGGAGAAPQQDAGSFKAQVLTIEDRPVERASVYWYRAGHTMKGRVIYRFTDANGWVSVSGLDNGTYWVSAFKEKEGYPDPLYAFNATPQASQMVEIEAGKRKLVTLRLGPKAARLEVRVVDAETGAELQGAKLLLKKADVANSDFVFSGEKLETLVPAETPLTLAVVCEGYARWEYTDPTGGHRLVLESGSQTTVTARLRR